MPIFRLEGDDIPKAKLIIAQETDLKLESHLEDWLENSPRALTQEPLLWIGRQTSASVEKGTIFPDLLGVDIKGNLIIVELKRNKAPREVVAQLLEYAAWADRLSESQIREIAETYFKTRDLFQEKTFDDTFRIVFDMLEANELPALNQVLRLFIVAAEIPTQVADVCQFLRTSHGMNISCINVLIFQTETEETLVSMETAVGNEDVIVPQNQRSRTLQPSWQSEGKSTKDVLWEAVQELTSGKPNIEFTQKEVLDLILKKYSDFNEHTLRRQMGEGRVNDPAPNHHSVVNPDGKYWWVGKGVYRLYDPEKDKIKKDEEVDLVKQGTENPT